MLKIRRSKNAVRWLLGLSAVAVVILIMYQYMSFFLQILFEAHVDPVVHMRPSDEPLPASKIRGRFLVNGGRLSGVLAVSVRFGNMEITRQVAKCWDGPEMGDVVEPMKGPDIIPTSFNLCDGKRYWLTLENGHTAVVWRHEHLTQMNEERVAEIELPAGTNWQVDCKVDGYHVKCP